MFLPADDFAVRGGGEGDVILVHGGVGGVGIQFVGLQHLVILLLGETLLIGIHTVDFVQRCDDENNNGDNEGQQDQQNGKQNPLPDFLLFRGILWGMATLVTVARTSCKFTFVFAKHMGLHRSEN